MLTFVRYLITSNIKPIDISAYFIEQYLKLIILEIIHVVRLPTTVGWMYSLTPFNWNTWSLLQNFFLTLCFMALSIVLWNSLRLQLVSVNESNSANDFALFVFGSPRSRQTCWTPNVAVTSCEIIGRIILICYGNEWNLGY